MTVDVDNNSGFCAGVIRAIDKAEEYLDKADVSRKRLYSLGAIVHNESELNRLASKGLVTIDREDLSETRAAEGETLLIRAHGEPPETYRQAESIGFNIIDCTCPVVLKLQKDIRDAYVRLHEGPRKGQIAIFGKIGHPEVLGLLGQTDGDAVVIENMKMLEDAVESSDDPLRAAIMAAVVGNIMDFGAGSAIDDPHQFMSVFDGMMSQGLGHDDTDELREELDNVAGVVYMFDNCGESQLDKVLIRQLRRMGKRVVGVVRGAPILNDVTMEDALRIGMDEEVDRLLSTGKFYIGIDWDDVPGDLAEEIRSCGLIIAKGMANFEATSDRSLDVPIVHILRTKCVPVATAMGVPTDINVVKMVRPRK